MQDSPRENCMKSAIASLVGLALLGACSDGSDQNAPLETPQQAIVEGDSAEAATPTPEPPALPNEFSRTAWRVRGEEGALYTTFLDPGGRYRDLRNGDPWQKGAWEYDAQERICFTPDAESSLGQCWRPERMDPSGQMIVTSSSGRRVRLESAEYRPPELPVDGENENEAEGDKAAKPADAS